MAVDAISELKKSATRAALIETAVALFTERGFDAVTIDQICAAVGVSSRTFFRYFPAKEHVVLYDVDVYKEAFSAVLATPERGESPRATARRAALAVATEVAARREDLRPRLLLVGQSPLLVAMWADLDRFWREGLVALFGPREPDADLVAGALVGGLNAGLARAMADPDEDVRALTARVFDVVVHGGGAELSRTGRPRAGRRER